MIRRWEIPDTLSGNYIEDLLVGGLLLIEIQASKTLAPEHEAQILRNLKATSIEHGILVNFGAYKLQIRKFIWTDAYL